MDTVSPDILKTAQDAAATAAQSGQHHAELAMGDFKIGDALPVKDADAVPRYIAVPVLRGAAIFGYFACSLTGDVLTFTSFCAELSDIDACPMASVWLNPRSIVQTASSVFPDLEQVKDMYPSFDGKPDRLAWRIIGQDADGADMVIFVMGLKAYLAP